MHCPVAFTFSLSFHRLCRNAGGHSRPGQQASICRRHPRDAVRHRFSSRPMRLRVRECLRMLLAERRRKPAELNDFCCCCNCPSLYISLLLLAPPPRRRRSSPIVGDRCLPRSRSMPIVDSRLCGERVASVNARAVGGDGCLRLSRSHDGRPVSCLFVRSLRAVLAAGCLERAPISSSWGRPIDLYRFAVLALPRASGSYIDR